MQSRKLHLGCGLTTPPGWINVDGSLNARLAQWQGIRKLLGIVGLLPSDLATVPWSRGLFIYDLNRPLPFADCCSEAIYCSHTLEHLPLENAKDLLKECYRVLVPGGVIRIVVPDLRKHIDKYLNCRDADAFMEEIATCQIKRQSRNPLIHIRRLLTYSVHQWMYDEISLRKRLELVGFKDVERRSSHYSRIADIYLLENTSRVDEGLCLEGVR